MEHDAFVIVVSRILFYGHFTASAVEVEGKTLAIVQEEERTAVLDLVIFRTHAQLVSDAISCAHEFGSFLMS